MTAVEYNACVDMYADALYRFVLSAIHHEAAAQDIVQDAFAKMWEKRQHVRFETSKTYLFKIAHNLIIDRWRKTKREEPLEPIHEPLKTTLPRDTDLQEVLHRALKFLPPDQRTVLLLRDYEGYSYKEIEQITKLNASQVKVYIYRARKKLKNILTRMGYVA